MFHFRVDYLKRAFRGKMTSAKAMKIMGINQVVTKNNSVSKKLEEYSEDEITLAFQKTSAMHSKYDSCYYKSLLSILPFPARKGDLQNLQDTHEAYQVLVKEVRAFAARKAAKLAGGNMTAAQKAAGAAFGKF